MKFYQAMLDRLKIMDERQLTEMFHDLDDLETVELIGDTANDFALSRLTQSINEVSQDRDAMQMDDARRAREFSL